MPRFFIALGEWEWFALTRRASRERRDVRQEAVWLIEQALIQSGDLMSDGTLPPEITTKLRGLRGE